jgi:hypothetical protein
VQQQVLRALLSPEIVNITITITVIITITITITITTITIIITITIGVKSTVVTGDGEHAYSGCDAACLRQGSVFCLLSALFCLLSAVCCLQSAVYCMLALR